MSVEPVEQENRHEQVKEAQWVAHKGGQTGVAIDEGRNIFDGNDKRPEENEDSAPVLAPPIMPEDEQFSAATKADQKLLRDGARRESSAGEVKQAVHEISRNQRGQGERGEGDALGARRFACRSRLSDSHNAESIVGAMRL